MRDEYFIRYAYPSHPFLLWRRCERERERKRKRKNGKIMRKKEGDEEAGKVVKKKKQEERRLQIRQQCNCLMTVNETVL